MSELDYEDRRKNDHKIDLLLTKVNELHQRQQEVVIPKLEKIEIIEKKVEEHEVKICELWDAKKWMIRSVIGAVLVALLGLVIRK